VPTRTKLTFRLPIELADALAAFAAQKRVTQLAVMEAALASLMSPDGADRLEAALARRLDRMSRQIERVERHVKVSNEALALFVRFWLIRTPPLPDGMRPSAEAQGRERYEHFIESLGRRIAGSRTLADEVCAGRAWEPGSSNR
jgi:predicted transcriptional regulator